MAVNMEEFRREISEKCKESCQDYRVHVTSKKKVLEQINKCKEILRKALDGQPEVAEETKKALLEELLANFETAIQVNVLVNGNAWEDAPDDDDENQSTDLETLLDENIVETTRKRREYPKKILGHAVHALKAERKLMVLNQPEVGPPDVFKDPNQETAMKELSADAPALARQTNQLMKSVNTLLSQAEGLCQVLRMQPSHASQEVHDQVFPGQSDAASRPRSRQPIKRAAEEAAASDGFIPLVKKPSELPVQSES